MPYSYSDDPYRAAMRKAIRGYQWPGKTQRAGGVNPYESYLRPRLGKAGLRLPSVGAPRSATTYTPPQPQVGGFGDPFGGDPNPEQWNPLGDINTLPSPSGVTQADEGPRFPPYDMEPGESLERQGLTQAIQELISRMLEPSAPREAPPSILDLLRHFQPLPGSGIRRFAPPGDRPLYGM